MASIDSMNINEDASLNAVADRASAILEPEFLRPADAYRIYRVKRGQLYRWIQAGKCRSILIRERGKARGIRLVVHSSLRDYILSHEVTPAGSGE